MAGGIQFPKQGLNLGPLLWEHRSQPLDPAGKALMSYFHTNDAPLMLRPLSWGVCQLVSEIDTMADIQRPGETWPKSSAFPEEVDGRKGLLLIPKLWFLEGS